MVAPKLATLVPLLNPVHYFTTLLYALGNSGMLLVAVLFKYKKRELF